MKLQKSNIINDSQKNSQYWKKLYDNAHDKCRNQDFIIASYEKKFYDCENGLARYQEACNFLNENFINFESQRDLLMALTDLEIQHFELHQLTETINSDNERLTSMYQNLYDNYRELKHDNANWSMLYKEALEINRIALETKNKLEKELATIKNNLK